METDFVLYETEIKDLYVLHVIFSLTLWETSDLGTLICILEAAGSRSITHLQA